MLKVIFVCHGNICRSPMAEYVFADLARKNGLSDSVLISSAAVSREEIGNDVYPPAKRELIAHGVPCPPHAAHEITPAEIEGCDYLLCMDERNLRRIARISPIAADKARLLGEYGLQGKEIEDPWYTDRYSLVYDEIASCCALLLKEIKEKI